MNPIFLQKQLRDNASDMNDFYQDLKTWSQDMKKKESQQNTAKSNKRPFENEVNKTPRVKQTQLKEDNSKPKSRCTDYSAWEKFDADAECEKIDYNDDDSDLTDEYDDSMKDEAYVQKEKGNKFVKDKKWDEAILCYNKAIKCYSCDPIFYANRALCFLKKENYAKAELDCTMSIRLDSTYVKAFQRRAVAREALGKLEAAESDLSKVLELEPKNKESSKILEALQKKLLNKPVELISRSVSKFTASRIKRNNELTNKVSNTASDFNVTTKINEIKPQISNEWHDTEDDLIPVKVVVKPVHLQSKKSLKRIEIEEFTGNENMTKNQSFPRVTESLKTFKTDDLKVIERHFPSDVEKIKENKNQSNNIKMNETPPPEINPPTNAVQFYSQWNNLKTSDNRYSYLKLIKPENLPNIFKESLESKLFGEILEILSQYFIKNKNEVYDYLKYLATMSRFSTLIMFSSETDKKYLQTLFEYIYQRGCHPKEQVDILFQKYEL